MSYKPVKIEQEENLLGVIADTIINPGTVVVHVCDAFSASRAMMYVWWHQRIAQVTCLFNYTIYYSVSPN